MGDENPPPVPPPIPPGVSAAAAAATGNIDQPDLDDLPLSNTPTTESTNTLVVISKKSRPTDPDKRQALLESITKNQHDRYKLMSTSLKSVDDLSETYGLQLLLQTTVSIFVKYDLLDVFVIVFPTSDPITGEMTRDLQRLNGRTKKVNLLKDYLAVTPVEVAESTRWYIRWTDHTRAPWIKENLSLTYEFFRNHVESDLWGKLLEDMAPYLDTPAQGGPLIFSFMIRRLQANSQLVIETLQKRIKIMRVDQYQGENISDMVSHIRAVLTRLQTLERKDENGRVITPVMPQNINKTLLKLFQTSSDEDFNKIFANKEGRSYEDALTMGDAAYGSYDKILDLALAAYTEISGGEKGWTGASHKASSAAFLAAGGDGEATGDCFNCGGKHRLDACPHPKNQEKIAKAKKAFWNAKKQKKNNGGGDGEKGKIRWPAAPTGDRKKNRRKIQGKYYFYHFLDKKWKLCDNQSESANKPYLANLAEVSETKKNDDGNKDESSKAKQAASNFIAAIQKNVNALAKDLV